MSDTQNTIAVLREMIRLAENRREEERTRLEKLNTYNFALIAFAGSFLSFLINTEQPLLTVRCSGFLLIAAIFTSLYALAPRVIRGGSIAVDEDIALFREGKTVPLDDYLIDTAEVMELSAEQTNLAASHKTRFTIISAILLASALLVTYILYIMPRSQDILIM